MKDTNADIRRMAARLRRLADELDTLAARNSHETLLATEKSAAVDEVTNELIADAVAEAAAVVATYGESDK